MNHIQHEVAIHKAMKDRLQAVYGEDMDEQTLLDTIEGETDIVEAIAKLMRAVDLDAALVDGINARKKELDDRKTRLENRIASIKATVLWAMEETGRKKIELPDMTLSARLGTPSVVIENEDEIPDDFMDVKVTPNKTRIKDILKGGNPVPGCRLSNGANTLSVRKQ